MVKKSDKSTAKVVVVVTTQLSTQTLQKDYKHNHIHTIQKSIYKEKEPHTSKPTLEDKDLINIKTKIVY